MKMKRTSRLIITICLINLSLLEGFAQNLSNKGREFWVGYGHHQFMEPGGNNSQEMVLYFSAEQTANVTVTVRGRTATQVTNYTVPAGTVIASNYMPKSGPFDCRLYDVPPSFGGNGGEGNFNTSIQIQSDVPIVAYAHIFGSTSSGASMLMPVETWGYSYISINSKQRYISTSQQCFSWAYVIAQQDNTVIEVTPSVTTRLGKPAGVPFTITLQKGQIYQTVGALINTSPGDGYEMSGTKIKSIANAAGNCYPVAVFSGSSRTNNPISCGSGGGDNDNQQCFPTQAWGKRYLTAPTSRSTAASQFMTNSYKVLVKDPTTIVLRNGVPLTNLLQNSYYFFESNTADYITADKPIMVAQFMTGGGCMGGGVGDPEMMYISPIEQGIKRIGFYRNDEENITVNYLTLIVPNGGTGLSSLRIDGSPAYDHSYPHPQLSGYTIVVKRWSAAKAQAIVYSDSAFTAITYGLGSVESYGYNAGTLINNLNAVSSIQNVPDPTTPQHAFTCTGTQVNLSVLMAYQPTRLEWLLSQLGTAITPNTDVNIPNPVSTGTVVVNGITYYKYTLPGTYTFNVADTHYIPLNGFHPTIENCYNRENFQIPVIVKQTPSPVFNFSHSGCTLDTVYFTAPSSTTNGYTISNYNWTFPGPVTVTTQNVNRVLPPGTHDVNLAVVTTDGCSADTTRQITIYNRPPGEFMVNPAALCVGSSFTVTDTSGSSIAVNEWYWDFGNGYTTTVTSGPTTSYTYPVAGTYTIKHVARSSVTCVSDTISRVVTVYAKPVVSFTNNANGCLDPSGLVQFFGTASAPDGQAIDAYLWNFGDPNATPPNPNTSIIQNPTHNYQQGTYNVNFRATTINGCMKDTTMSLTFNLKPSLAYPPLNAVCENAPAFSIANATVTNGVTGSGIYTGPGTNAAGMFDPAVAGYGTHTIWYKFTAAGNCVDSISQTILVHARPRTSFTIPASGCLPVNGQVQFTNTSTIPDAQTMTWLWNFNDPNATPPNPNTSTAQNPSHNFQQGTYNINLAATSSNGCVKDTTITAVFNLTPALAYPAITAVCQDLGAAPTSVASATVTNGVTGNGVYTGPGIVSPAGMFDPNAAGPGIHTITYTFTSAAGCSSTITSTIEVYPQPGATFTISPTGACLGQQVTFTSTASIASGNITSWNWNLGNGNTPTYPNGNPFTVNYATPNQYAVQLVTVSDRGCNSEPYSQNIRISPLPVADFTTPTGICMPGGATTFTNASTSPDNSALTYLWNFGDGNNSTQTNPTHNYTASGSYNVTLTVTSANGCVSQVSKVMNGFSDKPIANFSVAPAQLCQGTNSVFTNSSTAPNSSIQSYNWSFGDGSNSTVANPTKLYTNPGSYNVTLIVTNTTGCVSDPFIVPVTVHLQPSINAGADMVVPEGTIITLPATANSTGLTFAWSPPFGLNNPAVLNPQLTALNDQVYTLTATGNFGCTATDQISIKILKKVKVPNVFSPNGDNIHDQWMIPNLADYPGASVEVFNRYGQRVFYAAGYGTAWDGTYNGKPLPAGTYYYVIQLQNGFKPLSGSVTILR